MKKYFLVTPLNLKSIFILSVLLKIMLFLFLNYYHNSKEFGNSKIGFFVFGKDTQDYFEPIENLIDGKGYSEDSSPKAFRMPGLLPIYGPLYAVFSNTLAKQLFVLLQILADATIAFLIFVLLFKTVAAPLAISLAGWFLYIISSFVSSYNHYGLTETFATLAFVSFLFYFIQYILYEKNAQLFLSGLFLCWFIFLKPVGIVFIASIPLLIIIYLIKYKKKKVIFAIGLASLFVSSFLFFDGVWTTRNYNTFNKIIPLTSAFNTNDSRGSLKKFFRTTALTFQAFSGNDHMTWFAPPNDKNFDEKFSNSDPFPQWIYTSEYNLDTLKNLRGFFWQILNVSDNNERRQYETLFAEKVDNYVAAFKKEHPFHYYITVNAILFKNFLFVKTAYNLPFIGNSFFQKVLRGACLFLYYVVIIGFIFFTFLLGGNKGLPLLILLSTTWFFILTHVFMGVIENRYLVPIYPAMLIAATLFYGTVWNKIRGKKLQLK